MDETVLARWQARLLSMLKDRLPPAEIRRALTEDPELASVRDHSAGLDLHALAVAVELVAKWGR